MDINKAIRKQKKSYKIFMLSMSFIFLILPLALFITGYTNLFFLSYLIFIEIMILISIVARINWEKLQFQCQNNKLKIKVGSFGKQYILFCDKIVLVHTEKKNEDMEIIIVTSLKFRNKKIKPVGLDFHKSYPYAAQLYTKIKKSNPEGEYYYITIKKGGYFKYSLLDLIYKNSAKAIFTEEAIQNIKIARGQIEFN
ncbi:hypothetical protein [Desnuesiella massiliensis]|uniref:hypothetical protein n=1 Tax=Desnuesiella massiliensis TaxID=1650662 RepID=UPI0006E4206E|nr:hypothetical protein [Desnuesiella massiliensis]